MGVLSVSGGAIRGSLVRRPSRRLGFEVLGSAPFPARGVGIPSFEFPLVFPLSSLMEIPYEWRAAETPFFSQVASVAAQTAYQTNVANVRQRSILRGSLSCTTLRSVSRNSQKLCLFTGFSLGSVDLNLDRLTKCSGRRCLSGNSRVGLAANRILLGALIFPSSS